MADIPEAVAPLGDTVKAAITEAEGATANESSVEIIPNKAEGNEEENEKGSGEEDDVIQESGDGGLTRFENGREMEMEDAIPLMGDYLDSPEQKRQYMEYLNVSKEIEQQNEIIENVKANIKEKCAKLCKTKKETKEIKSLHKNMEEEFLKLRDLITKVMELQNYGSRRNYPDILIATTIEEDNLAAFEDKNSPSSSSEESEDGCEDW